ncbi:MAG: aminoglycoside phosphotransferase family protein [Acholeplasmatales bacterium]|jgi:RIO-like serine/threonine protein kinase|nr:aminoglycoside phosphotransferase family protein [Acholeplasmatales bacterium]
MMNYEKVLAVRSNKAIYQDGKKVIKVFAKDFSKSDCLNEALNQARVEETGLNVPRVLEVTILQEQIAIVSDFIPGKTLSQLIETSANHLAAYLEELVNIQLLIHAKVSPLLSQLPDKIKRKIEQTDLDAITKYELLTRLSSMPRGINQVLHGDFNPSNIIINPENKAYILDWSHATQGHPNADVANTYLLFCLEQKDMVAAAYLDIYCQKTQTPKKDIFRWFALVAAMRWLKAIKSEKEILKKWINVVEY